MNENIKAYEHVVQYHETDKMGITHHSNYIKWMEEARVDFLEQIGMGFDTLEKRGLVSPIISVEAKYKKSTTFRDVVSIRTYVEEFKGVRLKLRYVMTDVSGDVVCEATSGHCFLSVEGRPLRLNKEFPDFYEILMELSEN